MMTMGMVRWTTVGVVVLLMGFEDVLGLSVKLTIEPPVVEHGHEAVLHCSYELAKNESVYCVKWYRGIHEFFRYMPVVESNQPNTRVFPITGITVDIERSSSTRAVLKDIHRNISGNFTCEVTTSDAPYKTGSDTQEMLVVELPKSDPKISVGREPLDYGDMLLANCSSSASWPPATLKFILNDLEVASHEPPFTWRHQKAEWSDLALKLKLSEFHFSGGRLILRCIAQVADIYYREAVLELQSARRPVPQRVSAFGSANRATSTLAPFLLLPLLLLLRRL